MSRGAAYGLVALGALLWLGGGLLDYANDAGGRASSVVLMLGIAYAVVGVIIAVRQPRNPIGWIFLVASVSTGAGELTGAYAQYWVDEQGGSPTLGKAAALYANVGWVPFILLPLFLLLLFPDGRLPSRRWRIVVWLDAIGICCASLSDVVRPGPINDFPQVTNPIGVEGLVDVIEGPGFLVLFAGLIGSAASLVVRYRRSHGDLRLQIQWLALAGAIAAVVVPVAAGGGQFLWGEAVTNIASMLAVMMLPVATGIAILRYRLYDIDVVVNRTVVYVTLTAILVGVYVGGVLVLQLILSPSSDLAIAGSTLAVAALFRPLRARVQAVVDRRFFRRRYDAQATLQAFATRLRDQVSLEAVETELRTAVASTVQPTRLGLWLRSDA